MAYDRSQGYMPRTAGDIMESLRVRTNEYLGTNYTMQEFEGTNIYKVAYPLMQEIMQSENNLSMIFSKYADYISEVNQSINAPAVVRDSIIRKINELGVDCSLKQLDPAEAGNIFLCCDLNPADDNYSYLVDRIGNIMLENISAGTVSNGSVSINKQLENGQVETFKFELPTKTAILLKLTLQISRNNDQYIPTDSETKEILLNNLNKYYKLGNDFEPEKYAEINRDFPCCSEVILEYSLDNGTTWTDAVAQLSYDTKYTVNSGDITIVRT